MREVIKNKLIEVRNDFESLDQSKRNSMSLFHKHDLVLTGPIRNRIFAVELLYMIDLPVEKYLDEIPGICEEIGLKTIGVISYNELFNKDIEIRNFVIELN